MFPFVKWAGGKGGIVNELLRHIPINLTNYFEPFLGAGALFFGVSRNYDRFQAFLSDTNEDLINTYKILKNDPERLIAALCEVQGQYDETSHKSEFYYEIRRSKPSSPLERSVRFVFLNKTCYNGLYRVNSKGDFNVPFGRYENPRICDATNLRAVSKVLQATDARVEVLDYVEATENCAAGDFVYFDPPYDPSSPTSSFTDYTARGFSEKDQRNLAGVFKTLSEKGCRLLLSSSDTQLVRSLYDGFDMETAQANRSINSVGTRRTGYTELVITNESR